MNWLTNFVKPKLSALVKRKDVPENLWQNCPSCGSMIHHKDLKENLRVCNTCNHHFRMSADDRIKLLFSKDETQEIELDKISDDPLNFSDKKKYKDRLKEYRKKTSGRCLSFYLGWLWFLGFRDRLAQARRYSCCRDCCIGLGPASLPMGLAAMPRFLPSRSTRTKQGLGTPRQSCLALWQSQYFCLFLMGCFQCDCRKRPWIC